jgi:hypothetical protein
VTFTATAAHSSGGEVFYRFDLIPNYGTDDYDPLSDFSTIQEFSNDSSCTHVFNEAGGYIVVVWASDTTAIPAEFPAIIGGSIIVE